jgi:hypothetical protein
MQAAFFFIILLPPPTSSAFAFAGRDGARAWGAANGKKAYIM